MMQKKQFMRIAFALTLMTSVSAFAETVELKVGSVAPEDTPWSAWLNNVKKNAETKSNGGLKYKVYLGGRLGGEHAMVMDTQKGRLEMFGGSLAAVASKIAPELEVFELPMIFSSDAEADFVLNELRGEVSKVLEKRGLVFVMWAENGWHGFGSKGKCLDTPDALKGVKMRSQESKIHLDTFKAFGATPISMSVPEVMSGLQTGVVDGFSNTPIFSFATSWTSAVDHFTYTKHLYQPGVIVASKKWFDTLSPELQAIVKDTSPERDGIESVRALTKPILSNFTAMNVKVCPTNAAGQAAFKSASQGVWKKYAARSKANAAMLKKVEAAKAKFK